MTDHPMRLDAPPETLDDDPRLHELMTGRVLAITPDAPVGVAMRLMASAGVRHLPVIDAGRCLGLVLETDVLRAAVEGLLSSSGGPPPVGELTRRAPTLDSGDRRSIAVTQMHTSDIDAVLVFEAGRLVGIVTATDVIRSMARTGGPAA